MVGTTATAAPSPIGCTDTVIGGAVMTVLAIILWRMIASCWTAVGLCGTGILQGYRGMRPSWGA